jgi:DNA-binding winged helix-turn-helix (wHTH) protein
MTDAVFEFPPYRLDAAASRLWRGTDPVPLRPKAWALLCYLVARPGILVMKEELHAALWPDAVVSDDTLTHTVGELRRALGDASGAPRYIETVHRRGFRFIAALSGAARERPPAAAEVGASAAEPEVRTLVGRGAQLAALERLFERASSGERQTVIVEGEPGIGKSALVDAFVRALPSSSERFLLGYGQCIEQHGEREPYMAVLEAIERLAQGPFGPIVRSALRSGAPSWLARMPLLQRPADAERLRRWHADTTPQRMLRELAGLLETISVDLPLLIVVEDLHWSDHATADLIAVLAQRPERARLMLVATHRPAHASALDHPIQHVLATLRARGRCTEILLEYLSRIDVEAYLGSRFRGARVASDVAAVVHAHTDGNPLFMTVLVDHLLARGWLVESQSVWRLTVSHTAVEHDVPDNLRQLIEGHLRFVSPEERAVLEVGAVAGPVFDAPAVAAGLGSAPERVEAICHHLCHTQRWLRHVGIREWPDGALAARYAFQHALYQRTLYDTLSPTRRAALHERIGHRLEAGYAGRTVEASSELAKHFQGSRDQQRALVYLDQAATRAYDRRAYQDSLACLEPALRLLRQTPDTPDRARNELRMRRLYTVLLSQTAGYTADALRENLERTLGISEALGDAPARFDSLSALCLLHANAGDLAVAGRIGAQLSQLAERRDLSATLQSSFLRGALALWKGDLKTAEALLSSALASPVTVDGADRPYGVNPVVAARSFEGLRRWAVGDPLAARAVQQEGLTLAEEHGRPFTVVQAVVFGAMLRVLEEEWSDAEGLAARAAHLADEHGFPRWEGTARVVHGRVRVERGDDRGLAEIREGMDSLRRSGLRLGNSLLFSFVGSACLRLERLDEGLAAADAGLAHCRDTGERFFEAELWRLRAELIVRCAGSRTATIPEAEECFDRARAVARAQGAHRLVPRDRRKGARSARARTHR